MLLLPLLLLLLSGAHAYMVEGKSWTRECTVHLNAMHIVHQECYETMGYVLWQQIKSIVNGDKEITMAHAVQH